MEIAFWASGEPVPKGSKTAFALRMKGRSGYSGRTVIKETNSEKQRPWRDSIRAAALEAAHATSPSYIPEGPVRVDLHFLMPKPKNRPKKRPSWPDVRPDLDKLTRLVLDELKDVLYHDDGQVCELEVRKTYAFRDPTDMEKREPGVWVRVRSIP